MVLGDKGVGPKRDRVQEAYCNQGVTKMQLSLQDERGGKLKQN